MRFKSFVSMGVAAALIVPTLITAANPELAYAKTSSKTSKKISAKAKSVIAKIKAINPKKSNYVTKTKSAVNAYKKLSSKDKKMVYNYGTLKKHWTTVQNRKAKQVITKIKAINSKKSDYVLKTKSALSAYNKLSKTDKKKVTNYSTLKKHWKKIQPYLKKVDAFNKSVATLNKTNFTTKSVNLEKQYDNLDSITKAAVPITTLKTLSYYSDVVETKTLVFKTLADSSPTPAPTPTTTEDGTKILTVINAYKKLSGAQQTLLKDLINDNASAKANLDRYLALEAVVKGAADIEKQYAALKPTSKTYAQDLVNLFKNYTTAVQGNSIDYNGTTYVVSKFTPHKDEINGIEDAYKDEISKAKEFNDYIDKFEAGTLTDAYDTIKNKLPAYKVPSITTATLNYPKVAPIDLADKKAVTAYKKYEVVPDVVDGFKNANLPLLSQVTWAGSGEGSPKSLLTSAQISKLIELLPQYNKLGSNQKTIVQNALSTNNAKDYLSEGKNLTSAQAIDKSYASATKNNTKTSYFADLKKVYDAYSAATSDVKRFVVNAVTINNITTTNPYKTALKDATDLQAAIETLNESSKLSAGDPSINAVIGKYKIMAKQVPTPLSLVDAAALKTYTQFAAIPDVVKLVNKIPNKTEPTEGNAYGFKTNNINDILSAIKSYKKLGSTQQVIVDNEIKTKTPTIASLVGDESNIKEAQKIDSAYLKLKKSSKTYPKDAKKVKESYDDATVDAIKYLVNKDKIAQLKSAYEKPQKIADDFAALVNPLNKNSEIRDVNAAVKYYNDSIVPNTQASDLVDKTVMKKYNEYAPVSNVVKLLSLIKESKVDSPKVTPTDLYYIQKATIAYNALKPDPKMIIDDPDRTKFPFLYEGKYIKEAAAIDKAYEKVKPTDPEYEIEILDVYYKMYDRAPAIVQKYVINKAELDKIGTRYEPQLTIAREFETKVRQMSHISESGYTPTIKTVRSLEKYYYDNVKYNKINAKYNIPLSTLIDDEVMEEYNKYAKVLLIQDIAKTIYVLYGKLFNDENVEFDKVKDDFYCNDAKGSLKDPSRCHASSYYENSKKGYTDSGKKAGNPIKITNPNDVKLIYKAIDYFKQLDTPQIAILKKAPSSLTDTYYKDRFGGNSDPNTEEGDVHPSIPMSDGEIKNFLKAQEIDKAYEALNPSSKNYIQDAIVLYYKFYKAGKPVQLYVVHEDDIRAFEKSYNMEDIIRGVNNFVDAVNLLSNGSSIDKIKDGKDGVVDLYNKLNEAQLAVIDQGVLTKYNAYAPIAEIMALSPSIPTSGKAYSDTDINNMLKAISIYKKLAKDPKAIINVKNDPYKYLSQEADIKAAQKVDKAFKVLDKSDDKYLTKLNDIIKSYDSLSTTAQKFVISNIDIEAARKSAIYTNPSSAAADFENAVDALLDKYPMTYADVKAVVDKYNLLNSKAKSLVDSNTLKTYNKYSPIVTIVTTLNDIKKVPTEGDFQTWANYEKNNSNILESPATGFYKNDNQGDDVGTKILNAIQLYNKLGSDQKDIVQNKVQPANPGDTIPTNGLTDKQKGLLNETNNIKAAQALDKKIAAIKPKSTGYVKGVIDATKTLNVMPIEQRIYLQNVDVLKGYLEDSNSQKTQTQKAIDDLTKFEKGVKQVDQWTSEMDKDSNGNITGTCTTDDTKSPASTTTCSSTLITNQMNDLKTQFDQLNTPRLIDGSEVKLASLIDRTILARYQYFRAIYDVIDGLEK